MAISSLPKIVYLLGVDDSGEYGNATCPHCGAQGRYTYFFVCDDGERRGAMAGCIKLYPQHEFVAIHAAILQKQRDNQKKGWKLAGWDQETLDAITAYAAGKMSEGEAKDVIGRAKRAKAAWMKKKGYRR
jgi:hypothetical protein